MTKKHFIALADYVNEERLGQICQVVNGMVDIQDLYDVLADFCSSTNPRFDRQRWLEYVKGEK